MTRTVCGLSRFSAAYSICCCQIMISQLMVNGFFHREKKLAHFLSTFSLMTVDATEGLDVDEIV